MESSKKLSVVVFKTRYPEEKYKIELSWYFARSKTF